LLSCIPLALLSAFCAVKKRLSARLLFAGRQGSTGCVLRLPPRDFRQFSSPGRLGLVPRARPHRASCSECPFRCLFTAAHCRERASPSVFAALCPFRPSCRSALDELCRVDSAGSRRFCLSTWAVHISVCPARRVGGERTHQRVKADRSCSSGRQQ
jgi:hypothetical protein